MKNGKRIRKVTVVQTPDLYYNGEDSIGTFDNEAKSKYAIELDSPFYGYRYEGFKFYNAPVENYMGGTPEEELRKYVQQDYERMKSYQLGKWNYIGIRAEAELVIGSTIQRISSGGLWGIESDSDDYLKEVANEQLSELREQLHAIGFSKRAIATAFKSIEHQNR